MEQERQSQSSSCKRPNCPNKRGTGRQRFCEKHYWLSDNRGFIDATEAVERVKLLRECGYSVEMLAELTCMDRTSLSMLGQWTAAGGVTVNTYRAIMNIPIPEGVVAGGAKSVPNVGTRRRIQALMAFGYSYTDLAKELGVAEGTVGFYMSRKRLEPNVVLRVAAVFNRLEHIPGARKRSIASAKRKGWPPPLAWDEDTIDDANAIPTNPEDNSDWFDQYTELIDMGIAPTAAAKRLNVKWATVSSRLLRMEKKTA